MPDRSPDPTPPRRVAFLGLGAMGDPMARHLAAAGHAVTVYNRSADKAARWVGKHGHRSAPTPREAAHDAEFVFTCVGNDDDLREVLVGNDGALHGAAEGTVFVDHTTASADVARELATITAEAGMRFVDAPVSGGTSGAENGVLTVMCGGGASAVDAARPVLAAYARTVTHIGEPGAGQLAKMVNQIAIAGLLQGLAEAVAFGRRSGIDMAAVLGTISKGAAQSWQMDHRAATMLEDRFDFGFAVDWMRKDLGIALDEARRNGARLPVAALVDQFYADLQAGGDGRLDTSSLVKRLV